MSIQVPIEGLVHSNDTFEVDDSSVNRRGIAHVLISSTYISGRIKELAKRIVADAAAGGVSQLDFVIVLKGAAMFGNVLAQAVWAAGGPPIRFNYVKAASYGMDMTSSGEVAVQSDFLTEGVGSEMILLIEDIIDSGLTIFRLKDRLTEKVDPEAIKICTLLDKPSRRQEELKDVEPDYTGFIIPDIFVAGFGLDCAECLRELPFVAALREEEFHSDA